MCLHRKFHLIMNIFTPAFLMDPLHIGAEVFIQAVSRKYSGIFCIRYGLFIDHGIDIVTVTVIIQWIPVCEIVEWESM
jgi:hypothetical protein